MASKIVYVSAEHAYEHVDISIITPKAFDRLLEEDGWEVKKSSSKKIAHPESGKKVSVECFELRKERGLAVVNPPSAAPTDGGRRELRSFSGDDDRMPSHQRHGMAILGENPDSYLGRSVAAHLPGVRAISANLTQAAYGMGVDSAKMGRPESDNPFPEGSLPFMQWMEGFIASGGKILGLDDAAAEGRDAAMGKDDDEVTCKYQKGTRAYIVWLGAFRAAGGKVI